MYQNQDHGSVMFNEIEIKLRDEPRSDDGLRYTATGRDENGNEYWIEWETTDECRAKEERYKAEWHECINQDTGELLWWPYADDDESNACDWENPYEIYLIA